jgi:hypothetical protein
MAIFLRCKIRKASEVQNKPLFRLTVRRPIATRVSGVDLKIEHQLSSRCLLSRLAFLALPPFQKFLEELLLALSIGRR